MFGIEVTHNGTGNTLIYTIMVILKMFDNLPQKLLERKQALNEAKWKHVKNEISIKKLEEKLESDKLEYWQEIDYKIKLAEKARIYGDWYGLYRRRNERSSRIKRTL